MSESKKEQDAKILGEEAQERRKFLKKVGAGSLTAPAVSLLMSTSPIEAQAISGGPPTPAPEPTPRP